MADSTNRVDGSAVRLTVRHYCQGLGDSHLLMFPRPDGSTFKMLIDCGLHSIVSEGTKTIEAVAEDIRAMADGEPIDVLVVTHEHWDHVSGFHTAREIFGKITFKAVWMPWTENPEDALAMELDTHRRQALAAIERVGNALASRQGLSKRMTAMREWLDALAGFYFGAKGDKVRSARDAAVALALPDRPRYLEPGGLPIELLDLPGVRIFVLGPPRDRAMLKLEEREAEMYHLGANMGWSAERALSSSFGLGPEDSEDWVESMSPFSENLGHDLDLALHGSGHEMIASFVSDHYSGAAVDDSDPDEDVAHLADQDWRRIDTDWMAIASDLALQLDQVVNNTSLVLAFEFTDTERVALFPGDAQIGNWLSWQAVHWSGAEVKASDLLARTVYLKVAHHGSHNATPKEQGLELMTHPDLSAFIPVNADDARKARWHRMPFGGILDALHRKTSGRVVRADDDWVKGAEGRPDFSIPSGSIRGLRSEGKGWVEVDVA